MKLFEKNKNLKGKDSVTLENVLWLSLLCLAVSYIILYIVLALIRIKYPFELEWMEGGSVDHVARILSGQQLYVEPSLDFIPYIYTPLYFYISALFSKIFGVGFFALRFVSFLASLGCIIIIYQFVKKETQSSYIGLLSTCLFIATYKISGAWLDLARVDSLFLFFLLWSIFLIRFHRGYMALFASGLLISLAFFTKQTALFIAIPVSVYSLLHLPKYRNWIYPLVFLCITLVASIILNEKSGDWFYYYAFELPKQHPLIIARLILFWINDLIIYLPIASAFSLFFIVNLVSKRKYQDVTFYSLLLMGMIGASWFSRLHSGGYLNVLISAYAILSLLFGLGLESIYSKIKHLELADEESNFPSNNTLQDIKLARYFIIFLCAFQFATLIYNPFHLIPTRAAYAAGEKLINIMKITEGEIYLPCHGFLPTLSGKKSHAHIMAVYDVMRGKNCEIKNKLWSQIVNEIHNKKFKIIILDESSENLKKLSDEVEKDYLLKSKIFDKDDAFWTVAGMKTRPNWVYTARDEKDN